jgi:hypothetical protein
LKELYFIQPGISALQSVVATENVSRSRDGIQLSGEKGLPRI